jgi:O6-methylguanine-DNA--protein-cysteine methyltransferase
MRYTVVEAPIGGLLLLSDGASLTGLYLESQDGRLEPDGLWVRDDSSLKAAVEQLAAYFAGDLRSRVPACRPWCCGGGVRTWPRPCCLRCARRPS